MPDFTNHKDVFLTLGFGALGGLLAPCAQALYRNGGNLATFKFPEIAFLNWCLFTAFGALLAFASIYVLANSKRDDLKHLSAFALMCGIGFPSILLSTLDKVTQQSLESLGSAKRIAEQVEVPASQRIEASAETAVSTIKALPASEAGREGRALVEADTQAIIDTLAREDTARAREVFEAARDAGYAKVALPNTAPATMQVVDMNTPAAE